MIPKLRTTSTGWATGWWRRAGPSAGAAVPVFGVNDPTLNAFAMPGGNIGATGLILATQSESELAGVLATRCPTSPSATSHGCSASRARPGC